MVRWIFVPLAIACFGAAGCSSSKNDETSAQSAYSASGADPATDGKLPPIPDTRPESASTDVPETAVDAPMVGDRTPIVADGAPVIADPDVGFPIKGAPPESVSPKSAFDDPIRAGRLPERELRPGFSAEQLVEFLAGADRDMQSIVSGESGIENPEQAREVLIQIIKLKLEASRRLARDTKASPAMASEGARGELQSLSHLAALGDLNAAIELEKLAEQNLSSDDPRLVSDSRLVLIGFAIEQLQNGKPGAANKIVDYVDQLAATSSPDDVPAMMVMGEARDKLARYGHEVEAKRVRDQIIDVFADSKDAAIAQMAAQVAGNVLYDAIDALREKAVAGQPVSVDDWRQSAVTLVDESADLQTVQYLAGAALEFESIDRDDLVDATYEVLQASFSDLTSATGREVDLAVRAKQARTDTIGRTFDPDLPSIGDATVNIADYRGKVVLMPFWATTFPESLQILPQLRALVESHPDDVVILGMNLDVEGTDVAAFVQQNELGFPNYHAESSPTAQVTNPVAAKFGLVSMPFVAIVDRQGKIAELDFTGRKLADTVEKLIAR